MLSLCDMSMTGGLATADIRVKTLARVASSPVGYIDDTVYDALLKFWAPTFRLRGLR